MFSQLLHNSAKVGEFVKLIFANCNHSRKEQHLKASKIKFLTKLTMAEPPPPPPPPQSNHTQSPIYLRRLTLSDVDDFMVWASDDLVSRFCRWDTFTSKDDALNYLTTTVLPHPYFRAICLRNNNRPVGAIHVEPFPGNYRCKGMLGYALASEYWGRGIASTAVEMVATEIFEEWPHLERLEAFVDVENSASMRVLEKVGFVREGVMRKSYILKGRTIDMVVFSMLDSERSRKREILI
ncbi:hypothetical protein Sjap_007986 [Stephania japonica]|uniref:N-acetyltransferase domain-containing protein n=1 Tax=Stephania japonica TaxID=461633 RepID=A0AAP0PAX9_9MAGN